MSETATASFDMPAMDQFMRFEDLLNILYILPGPPKDLAEYCLSFS